MICPKCGKQKKQYGTRWRCNKCNNDRKKEVFLSLPLEKQEEIKMKQREAVRKYYLKKTGKEKIRTPYTSEESNFLFRCRSRYNTAVKKYPTQIGLPFTISVYHRIMIEQNRCCAITKKPFKKLKNGLYDYHIDHIIPLSKGGLHCPTNIRFLDPSHHYGMNEGNTRLGIREGTKNKIIHASVEGMVCIHCNEHKPLERFEYRKDRGTYRTICRKCRYVSMNEKRVKKRLQN